MGEAKLRASLDQERAKPPPEEDMKFAPVLPLLSGYGGSLHSIEMRLREIKAFMPDAMMQPVDYRIAAALKILSELLKE